MAGLWYVVLTDGAFAVHRAQSACVLLRYAGAIVPDAMGFGGGVPSRRRP